MSVGDQMLKAGLRCIPLEEYIELKGKAAVYDALVFAGVEKLPVYGEAVEKLKEAKITIPRSVVAREKDS